MTVPRHLNVTHHRPERSLIADVERLFKRQHRTALRHVLIAGAIGAAWGLSVGYILFHP